MGCQTPRRIVARFARAGCAMAAVGIVAATPAARAHQSDFVIETGAGSGGHVDFGIGGQWGFSPSSPYYLHAEAGRGAIPGNPREDVTHFAAEAGSEGKRFGFVARHETILASGYSLAQSRWGVGFRLRFIPWAGISTRDEIVLSREDREAKREERERAALAAVPTAPYLMLDYDVIQLSSPAATDGGMTGARFSAALIWKLKPGWTLIPSLEAFNYPREANNDAAGATAYASRALRMLRLGPMGPASEAFGLAKSSQQILARIRLNADLSTALALSRATLSTVSGGASTYSLWVSFDRKIGASRKWTAGPAYEHMRLGAETYGLLAVRVRYEFNGAYQP